MATMDEILIDMIDSELQYGGEKYLKTYDIESKFQEKVITLLKRVFGKHIWFAKISDRYNKGIPDIVGCINGKFFAIELKATNGRPTKLQEYTIDKIEEAGGKVCIARTMAECLGILKSTLMT